MFLYFYLYLCLLTSVQKHYSVKNKLFHDVALLKLASPATIGATIGQICLPRSSGIVEDKTQTSLRQDTDKTKTRSIQGQEKTRTRPRQDQDSDTDEFRQIKHR
jgi:hypothetical protein